MPHGAPDDSDVLTYGEVFRLDDMAELVARLGSIITYHRGGTVLFQESFESGFHAWATDEAGDASEIELSNVAVFAGGIAVYMNSGTGADPRVAMSRSFPPPAEGKVGLQTCFNLSAEVVTFGLEFNYWSGAKEYNYRVRYDHIDGKLYYYAPGGTYTELADVGVLSVETMAFHNIKLVVDLTNEVYDTLWLGGAKHDMSTLSPESDTSVEPSRLQTLFELVGDGSTAADTYIDNVACTFNET